jgi:DNA-binding protein HU-beta
MIEIDQDGETLRREQCSMESAASNRRWRIRRDMAANRMTQTQLVRALAEKCEVNNKVAKGMLEHLANTAIGEVKKNGMFVLPGIGRLVRVDRKARMGRNPATGEAIKIAAKKVVKFRVAKSAKDAIVPPKKK